ncbi:amidoligase family protein [Myceligenerans pegani]|uniref:Amidoligase family protein n=1 Tax=Myceligenerans pegani TaxID=2776917 RepID=A0ABR9N0Z3_9MICO|nr:amidoligase family protein [Myceligenerans sp. TRM 65318]MBE1876682.1 amidoligase family protein [Myceligenerans sp. TRM 65318]MBE3018953.1 amidoligase family protein [Myceligenerans sp. TRM 65318]
MRPAPLTARQEATIDTLTLRTGFEIELLAPVGSDRQELADALAARRAGRVRRSFHTDSEPSAVPGVGVFRHLSPAFDVVDDAGSPVARLVDDITLTSDLNGVSGPPGHRGWYRVLCDEARLLRLIERHADPDAPLPDVLGPVAELFGTRVELVRGAARVNDTTGATVAVAMPLPGGRERPCELITPPISRDHGRVLEELLAPARALGFTVPVEAAVHLHLDGAPFRRPAAFANLVRLFGHWREPLWEALGTNAACRRLGALPDELCRLVEREYRSWTALRDAARGFGLTKYADVNLTQLVSERPARDTVEVRILPGALDGASIVRRAALVERLLRRCLDDEPLPRPDGRAPADPAGALLALATTGAGR